MTGAVFMILFIKNHFIWFPSVQHCNWFGFRISLSLSLSLLREGAIFRDEIENYFSCSRLARRDRDYHMTILVFRDENEIRFCYYHVSRRDRDFRKSFLVVEREKMKLTLVENSRDWEFSLTSVPRLTILAPWNMCPCTDNQPHMVWEKGEGHCPITLQNCWFAFKSMVSSGCKFKSKKMYKRYKVYTEWYIKVDDVRFFVFLLLYCSLAPSGALIAIPT